MLRNIANDKGERIALQLPSASEQDHDVIPAPVGLRSYLADDGRLIAKGMKQQPFAIQIGPQLFTHELAKCALIDVLRLSRKVEG